MKLPLPLVLATGNPDKAREIVEVFVTELDEPLAAAALTIGDETVGFLLDRPETVASALGGLRHPTERPDVEETGTTFEENARIKAEAVGRAFGTVAVAEDTGLVVDSLGGRPGVQTARYAGAGATAADNVRKLLDEVRGRSRAARFVTVALVWRPDGDETVVRGEVEGSIAEEPRGDGGWGYDPVFVPRDADGRTFAEMSAPEKHALSHRGRAFRALAAALGEQEA